MTIGQLARAAGVRASTLRFYERRGLLVPASRSGAGYRRYGETELARVRFLRRAQELGFTLAELGALLVLSRGASMTRAVAREKIAEIERRIADLGRVRRAISHLLAADCIASEAPCPIIAALANLPRSASRPQRASTAAPRRARSRAAGRPLKARVLASSS